MLDSVSKSQLVTLLTLPKQNNCETVWWCDECVLTTVLRTSSEFCSKSYKHRIKNTKLLADEYLTKEDIFDAVI